MNIYALFPLIATIAYVPLLVTTIVSRPWRQQHKLFILFLIPAILWSLSDLLLRSGFFPEHDLLLGKLIIIMFIWMVVQFHCFTSSFFSPGQGRWLPFAYATLAAVIVMAVLGYIPEDIVHSGGKIYPEYGNAIVFMAVPLLTLVARNLYIFWKRLKSLDNPVLHNQIVSLVLGISVLAIFVLADVFIPWGREFPISHFGNIINAVILSYAIIRHQLVDIRFVLRRGLVWISLGGIGISSYWLLFAALHYLLNFELDSTAILTATRLVTSSSRLKSSKYLPDCLLSSTRIPTKLSRLIKGINSSISFDSISSFSCPHKLENSGRIARFSRVRGLRSRLRCSTIGLRPASLRLDKGLSFPVGSTS